MILENPDVVIARSRSDLEAWVRSGQLSAWLTELVNSALAAGEGSDAWSLVEFELGTLEQP